jgi:hypothetical protein
LADCLDFRFTNQAVYSKLESIEMTIKDFGARVVSVWEGLRPLTKKMLVGALQATSISNTSNTAPQKFSYDAHADWELSRLLSALDEQAKDAEIKKDREKLREIRNLADACASVLQDRSESAEVFVQLAERTLARHDYKKIDVLADILAKRFSVGEIAEIIRQTELPQIRAIAFETLAQLPAPSLVMLLDDPIYHEIAHLALEQQAFEFDNAAAQQILEQMDFDELNGE